MTSYEDIIKRYVERNLDTLNEKASSKRRLLKFSEAVSRAITENKKSDTGYGDIAESLASAGLSESGYADYLKERGNKALIKDLSAAENEKELSEARDDVHYREELQRLENERLEAEKKEQERLEKEAKEIEKLKKTVASFASANSVVDFEILYDYAISLGLSEDDAKAVSESSVASIKEKIRTNNIEKTRKVIISERLTKPQAYSYAISLGLSEEDAMALSEFAYKMNQDAEYIVGQTPGRGGSNVKSPQITNKKSQIIFN